MCIEIVCAKYLQDLKKSDVHLDNFKNQDPVKLDNKKKQIRIWR